ncbi:MAG: helix-turn-helix domain-containing protein [Lachnospiraceae bacterium]|nr:helix-turn-helix domain-containing protein [Lachnospiraceae bacterium]
MKLTLAENIRAFRKERRLTQEQFAEAMGVTVGSVYKWETGQTIPELNMVVELADFFDTSMDVLLGYRVKDLERVRIVNLKLDGIPLGGYREITDEEYLQLAMKLRDSE